MDGYLLAGRLVSSARSRIALTWLACRMVTGRQLDRAVLVRVLRENAILQGSVARGTAVAAIGSAVALLVTYRHQLSENLLLAAGCGAIIASYARLWWRNRSSLPNQRPVGNLFDIGVSWAATLIAISACADIHHAELIGAGTAALMSFAVFAGPFPTSMTFWAPVSFAGVVAGILTVGQGGWELLGFIAVFGPITFLMMFALNAYFVCRTTTRMEDEKKGRILTLALNSIDDGRDIVWEVDKDLRFLNPPAEVIAILAERSPDPLGLLPSLFDAEDENVRYILTQLEARKVLAPTVVTLASNGEPRKWRLAASPAHDDSGEFIGYEGIVRDVTMEFNRMATLNFRARFDALTTLLNRGEFDRALGDLDNCLNHVFGSLVALLLVDLDGFKEINDTMGHAAGDQLLRIVGSRLQTATSRRDSVYRIGGDEFAILAPIRAAREATGIARRIIEHFHDPVVITKGKILVTCSIGVASHRCGDRSRDIFDLADRALYDAKKLGKNRFVFVPSGTDEYVRNSQEGF